MVSPRTFGFFGISAVLSIFFLGLFLFFGIYWNFGSFDRFLQSPTKTKVLIGVGHSSGPFGGGGGFSQDFWIYWIFRNFCSSEHFFGIVFLFFGILGNFCSFELFFSKPY